MFYLNCHQHGQFGLLIIKNGLSFYHDFKSFKCQQSAAMDLLTHQANAALSVVHKIHNWLCPFKLT